MLDIKLIRQNPKNVKEGAQKKGVDIDIEQILRLDEKKRRFQTKLEKLRHQQRRLGLKKPLSLKKLKAIKNEIKKNEKLVQEFEEELKKNLLQIPNLPLDQVPVGKSERDNVVLRTFGKKSRFDFKPRSYLEIAQKLDLIDIKRAAKISGTRFGFLKNEAALLEFALINLVFDNLTKEGFIPVIPPIMLKPEMLEKSGHLSEKDKPERYFIEKDNVYLAGTAEQPIAAMHADEIFDEKDLPRRYLGFSSCFRREAGAYGKDTKGIFRVHQFDKIEMFSFCHPEKSRQEHQFLLSCQEKLMQLLKIPYRVIQICTGDLGFPAAAAYDVEAWLPSENRYRETHTTFNDTDFQTRRLNIRYRDSKTKKLEFTHALNGTAFAIGRTLIAILENYQTPDGKVEVPEVLKKYLGKEIIG